jgi:hypothetical protein
LLSLFLSILFFEAIVNGIVFLSSFSVCSLLVYRKATEFCILILHLAMLLKVFMMSQSVLVKFLGILFLSFIPGVGFWIFFDMLWVLNSGACLQPYIPTPMQIYPD